jgi:Domain of unknown function (DUF4398)
MVTNQRTIDPPRASCYGRQELGRLRRLRTFAAGSVLVLAPFAGCGPVEYINQVGNKAAEAVSAAKLAQADRYAPYEYTAAEQYLHQAREVAGHAEYQDAIEYGHRSEDLANRARALALAHVAEQPSKSSRVTPAGEREDPAPGEDSPETAAGKLRARERAKKPESE